MPDLTATLSGILHLYTTLSSAFRHFGHTGKCSRFPPTFPIAPGYLVRSSHLSVWEAGGAGHMRRGVRCSA